MNPNFVKICIIAIQLAKQSAIQKFYTLVPLVNSSEQLALTAALERAIDQSEFILHYQPQVDLRTRAIVGAEALLRWQ